MKESWKHGLAWIKSVAIGCGLIAGCMLTGYFIGVHASAGKATDEIEPGRYLVLYALSEQSVKTGNVENVNVLASRIVDERMEPPVLYHLRFRDIYENPGVVAGYEKGRPELFVINKVVSKGGSEQ